MARARRDEIDGERRHAAQRASELRLSVGEIRRRQRIVRQQLRVDPRRARFVLINAPARFLPPSRTAPESSRDTGRQPTLPDHARQRSRPADATDSAERPMIAYVTSLTASPHRPVDAVHPDSAGSIATSWRKIRAPACSEWARKEYRGE